MEERCYRSILGHCATSTLQHNKFEAEHAKIIFFEILQTILESTAYDCFGNLTSFLHPHHQAETADVLGQSHSLHSRRKVVFLPTVLSEAQHTPCQGINSDIITQRRLTESVFVILQLSEFFPVHWEEHGSTFRFVLLKTLFVLMPTYIG